MALPKPEIRTRWWEAFLLRLYETLTLNDPVQAADLVFVAAGRMERKQYGLELYREGVAPRLIISVGSTEVHRMWRLNLDGLDGLVAARDNTRPEERHFFVGVDCWGTRVEKVRLPRLNTYGEAVGLRRFLEGEVVRSVIVVSTDVHLRRIRVSFRRVFRGTALKVLYCHVPSGLAPFTKDRWWMRSDVRRLVLKEGVKLAGYRLILSLPDWLIRTVMRLRC